MMQKEPWKMTKTLAHGYSSKRESFPMNTNMTGFRWFSKIFASLCFGQLKVASALKGLNEYISFWGNLVLGLFHLKMQKLIKFPEFWIILDNTFLSLLFVQQRGGGVQFLFIVRSTPPPHFLMEQPLWVLQNMRRVLRDASTESSSGYQEEE